MQPLRDASSFCWNYVSAFMTAQRCVGTATIIDFGKHPRIVRLPGRGMDRNSKHGGSPPPLTVLLGLLQRQIVLSEPLRIAYFLTAPMAACKISLVQITSPFSGLGDFLHDLLGTVMVRTCFSGKFRTFSGSRHHKF